MDQITFWGLDLGEYYSQISYFREGMNDAESISARLGSQTYLIPMVIAKRSGIHQWYIGEEAFQYPERTSQLLGKAYKRERVLLDGEEYQALDLLTIYIRRVLAMTGTIAGNRQKDYYLICVSQASQLAVETLLEIVTNLGIPSDHVKICSRKETFCYYVMNQEPSLRMNDVLLMDYWGKSFKVYKLHQDRSVSPMVVSVSEIQIPDMERIHEQGQMTQEEIKVHKDEVFLEVLDVILTGQLISSVYLVGEGFEGDWMKKSLSRLCAGKRVFSGMNLYSKGACYYGKSVQTLGNRIPEYLYLGGGNLLYNICLKVYHQGEYHYYVLIPAGVNWQDAKGEMEVILDDGNDPVIEIVCKPLKDQPKKAISCRLEGLNVRKDLTTRLRLSAYAVSKERIKLKVKDIGFGEMFPATDKEWNFDIRI